MDTTGRLIAQALAAGRERRQPLQQDIIILAGKAQGYTGERLMEMTGLSRQGLYDALERAGFGVEEPVGTAHVVRTAHSGVLAVLGALEDAGMEHPVASTLLLGRVRRAESCWLAEAGSGETLRSLKGRHLTKTDAVVAVLSELDRRRQALADSLQADDRTRILTPLIGG